MGNDSAPHLSPNLHLNSQMKMQKLESRSEMGLLNTLQHAWAWMLWLLSQCWITFHIWVPHCERLAPTEKLFVTPWYCSLLPDQSLALNRRRDDEGEVKTEDLLDRQVRGWLDRPSPAI